MSCLQRQLEEDGGRGNGWGKGGKGSRVYPGPPDLCGRIIATFSWGSGTRLLIILNFKTKTAQLRRRNATRRVRYFRACSAAQGRVRGQCSRVYPAAAGGCIFPPNSHPTELSHRTLALKVICSIGDLAPVFPMKTKEILTRHSR